MILAETAASAKTPGAEPTRAIAVAQDTLSLEPFLPQLAPGDRERVDAYVARASADATLRAYQSDWCLFCAWCEENSYRPLPAALGTVAAFVTLLVEHGFVPVASQPRRGGERIATPLGRATIGRRLAAIVFAHRAAGLEPPAVRHGAAQLEKVMRAIRREKRSEGSAQKRPADGDVLRDMLRNIAGGDLRALRDRALLAVGMAGAFRRSELVAITVGHVVEDTRGLLIRVPISKTDQEGRGHSVAIPDGRRLEPVRHYRRWLERSEIISGPVFRKLTPQGRVRSCNERARGCAGGEGGSTARWLPRGNVLVLAS